MPTTTETELELSLYETGSLDNFITPVLAIYPEIVRHNLQQTLNLLGGDGSRWRPHVKTAKLGSIMKMLADSGIKNFKCATSLELLVACEAGAEDVLVAYPHVGGNARRIAQIAGQFPKVRVSVLVENADQVANWKGTPVSVFIDVNPGMNRTGVEVENWDEIRAIAKAIQDAGLEFRGLHYYDGHITAPDMAQREKAAHSGYDRLMALVENLNSNGLKVEEVITAGTTSFPCTLSYEKFRNAPFIHRASPGTLVYSDVMCAERLPESYQLRPAAIVISRVISHPRAGIITCDAGHKTLSVDQGVPNCVVLEAPAIRPMGPSEEHLPMEIPAGVETPAVGSYLHLVPRHVCPTVNNFDYAVMVEHGRVSGIEPVSARGREGPQLPQA